MTSPVCPAPVVSERVEMLHGAGGRRAHSLIETVFRSAFSSPETESVLDGTCHDSAVLPWDSARVAVTTDSYVVTPLFFPGGDIGRLAVLGTLNDLAMVGARPVALTAGFVLEEGLPISILRSVVESMASAARERGVSVVAGDTKVVERGQADGLFITTTGVGAPATEVVFSPARIQAGDAVIVSGDLGRHGMAVLAAREGFGFEGVGDSDLAALWPAVSAVLGEAEHVAVLRDLTRGGLGAVLNELSEQGRVQIDVEEHAIAVSEPVSAACELLGLDPLYVANEGRFVAIVRADAVERVLRALRGCAVSSQSTVIGSVTAAECEPGVTLRSRLGTRRPVDWLGAEQLPRIC